MKGIRYISSVPVINSAAEQMNSCLGIEENGRLRLFFGDPTELGQDTLYLNDGSFPNGASMATGRDDLWISMFGRHQNFVSAVDDQD